MEKQSRRRFLHKLRVLGVATLWGPVVSACRERVVEVEKTVEVPREVTRVVKEIVRETVLISRTPGQPTGTVSLPAPDVQRTETAAPAPRPPAQVVADVLSYGWTQLGMQMTPTFEEMFPHIGITWRSLSDWQHYNRHIAALHASDQLGDLIEAPLGVLPISWAQNKLVQPLDELMSADGFEYRSIFPGAVDACVYDGQHIALPFVCSSGENLLLYAPRLWRGAGIAEPAADWMLDDLQEVARALTKKLDNGQGMQYGQAISYEMPGSYPMLRLFDAYLFSEDGREPAVQSANMLACLDWARNQTLVERTAPTPAEIERGALAMLLQGRVAMIRHSLRTLIQLSGPGTGQRDVQGTLFPRHPTTGRTAAHISGMAYAITARSMVAAEAFQWIKFMSSREMGVQMFLGGYAEPGCRIASWKDPRVVELSPLCSPIADSMVVAKAARNPWNLRIAACMDAWNVGIRRLWHDDLNLAQVAEHIAKAFERILREPPENLATIQDPVGVPSEP